MKFTNKHNIPLPLAVMLIHDEYDYNPDPHVISVTSLLKSVRRIVLESRGSSIEQEMDISDLIASTQGTALHDALERAWLSPKLPEMLKALGIPERVANQIRVNPTDGTKTPFDVFLEQRTDKKIGKWTISGKFDFIMEGKPKDLKNTSVFKWSGSDDDYIRQLSLYRWLNPELTDKDLGDIMFWFKDFNKHQASKSGYPPFMIVEKPLVLTPPAETNAWVRNKLARVDAAMALPEPELPHCTKEELWQSEPEYKYYSSPSAKRASKVSTSFSEVQAYQLSKGKGFIKEVPAEPKACAYCSVRLGCSQYGQMVEAGVIK